MQYQSGSTGLALLFNLGARWGWVVSATPRPPYPQEKSRLGAPQSRSRRVRKNSPLPGCHPRTVQPVASRCTDWASSYLYQPKLLFRLVSVTIWVFYVYLVLLLVFLFSWFHLNRQASQNWIALFKRADLFKQFIQDSINRLHVSAVFKYIRYWLLLIWMYWL